MDVSGRPPNTRMQRARSSASPPHSRLTRNSLGGLVCLLMACGTVLWAAPEPEMPFVVAERLSINGMSWNTAIYRSGFAHQRLFDTLQGVDMSCLYRLSTDQVRAIEKAVAHSHFCELPSQIEPDDGFWVEHEDYLVVTVRLRDASCTIGGSGFERLTDGGIASRFDEVWSAITLVAPDPPE